MKKARLDNTPDSPFRNPAFLFAMILLAGLAIRLLLLQVRWINPDEGAHLLDARLLLDGQWPVADFGSRQPFYVLLIAAFLKVFGVTLWAGRLMPLLSSLGVVKVLYFFGKKWFDSKTGLTSALIYALLPLVVIWSTIVKTEQLAIFLGLSSMFLLLEGLNKRALLLFLSGVLAALAFYVRQPTLYLPMAAVLFLLISKKNWFRNIILYALGYLLVTAVIFLLYLPKMGIQDILFSQLNPLNLIWSRLMHLFGWLPAEYSIVDNAGFRVLDQGVSYTLNAWYHALAFSLFIVFGAISLVFSKRFEKGSRQREASTLFLCWIGFAVLLYFYQTASRGFYSQYFTEALPPLILLASVFIVDAVEKINVKNIIVALAAVIVFYGIYLVQKIFWQITPGMVGYLVLSIGLAGFVFFFTLQQNTSFRKLLLWIFVPILTSAISAILLKSLGMHDLYRFILALLVLYTTFYGLNLSADKKTEFSTLLMLIGFFYAAFYSGHIIGPKYEAIWAQSTLKNVSNFLQEDGETSYDILSGGTIWTFESGLQPYLNVPHPTEFFKHQYDDFELVFAKNPPHYIILDGYTERKFARYWTFIKEQMDFRYTKVKTFDGSKYPVEIYVLKPDPRGESGFLTEAVR